MKCSESPTTFTAPNLACGRAPAQREIAAAFEGLLLQQAFAPLAKAIGFYGDAVVAAAAQAMARNERGRLGGALNRVLELEVRDDVSRGDAR